MKTLVLESTAPFQGLPELVAYDEGLFAREGLEIKWADRDDVELQDRRQQHHQSGRRRSVRQPRQAARAGQGRHVQRLRMGQLLPRAGHRRGQPAGRPPRHRHLRRRSWCARTRPSTPPSSSPTAGSACRSISAPTISRSICWKASCRATDQAVQRQQRLAQALRRDDVRRGRGDDLDRALSEPRREEGLPRHLLGLLSRHRGRLRQGRCRDLLAPSTARCARRCAASPPTSASTCSYFIDYHKAKDPEIATLTVDDLRESRIVVCDPAPIPDEELQRTYEWVKSWGMLGKTASPLQLVNMDVQQPRPRRRRIARRHGAPAQGAVVICGPRRRAAVGALHRSARWRVCRCARRAGRRGYRAVLRRQDDPRAGRLRPGRRL